MALFYASRFTRQAGFSSERSFGGSILPALPLSLPRPFDSVLQPFRLNIFFPFLFRVNSVLSTKGSTIVFLCLFGTNFLELSFCLGILDLFRLILVYRFLLLHTRFACNRFFCLIFDSKQHDKVQKVPPNN